MCYMRSSSQMTGAYLFYRPFVHNINLCFIFRGPQSGHVTLRLHQKPICCRPLIGSTLRWRASGGIGRKLLGVVARAVEGKLALNVLVNGFAALFIK